FAYHFYRLLQRASEICLIYDTESGQLGGGEPSRFIRQLMHELPDYQPGSNISHRIISLPPPPKSSIRTIAIGKTTPIMEVLSQKAEKGFSPTTLIRYRNCSLQFYFHEIARLQETEEVEESLEARTMGNIVHHALEQMYKPFVGKSVTTADVDMMLKNVNEFLTQAYRDKYPGGDITMGRNRLLSEVIKRFVVRFLEHEKQWLETLHASGEQLFIRGLEEEVKAPVSTGNQDFPNVMIRGNIDRVDETGGIIRIIDYKTGQVKESVDLRFKSWEEFLEKPRTDKAFQVLTYAWLYHQNHKNSHRHFESGVISMRRLSQWFARFGIKNGEPASETLIDENRLEDYEHLLRETIESIFDPDTPFVQTDDQGTCKYCNFNTLCRRFDPES
ncbi:MAG: PD-(D/E)XK nuclease family protein, partial [Bacteroidota bacterium]